MQCERCKAELLPDAKFCPECGQIVVRPGQQENVSSPAVASLENKAEGLQETIPAPVFAPESKAATENTATPLAFVPASHSTPSPVLASPLPGYAPTSSAFFRPAPAPSEESDFYHIDAMEKPDFEAMRGISIFLILISICTFVGILFPMPLAIVSLVSSCGGIGERDPIAAKRKFDTCRTMVIVTVITLLAIVICGIIFLGAMGYLTDSLSRNHVSL